MMNTQKLKVDKKAPIITVVIIGVLCVLSILGLYQFIQRNHKTICEASKISYEKKMVSDVDNLIAEIDAVRNNGIENYVSIHGTRPAKDSVAMEQIDEQAQSYIHDILDARTTYNGQYYWINEVVDYSGGDNYAFRFVHQNLKETEGNYLSTNVKDAAGNKPYAAELAGINEDGEIYHSYYFKNLQDDSISRKYSYSKLYEPYDWIVSTGIPEVDMYPAADIVYNLQMRVFPLLSLFMVLFYTAVIISATALYKNSVNMQKKFMAQRQNSFKSDFLSNMSHDLRTPMNAIVGSCDLAQKSSDEAEIRMNLKDIKTSSDFLLSLINDILDISAIEEGRLTLAIEPFDLKELVYTVTSLYQLTANQKHIKFYVHGSEVRHEWLKGDVYRLSQVVSNLLSNAFKFTDAGGEVTFDISEYQLSSGKVKLCMSVIDTGCGMSEEVQERIFSKFVQANASTVRNYGGSGLGLSIAKSLTDLMGGTISVASTLNVGSKFTVCFELEPATDDQISYENAPLDRTNILIVDDDLGTCKYVSDLINELGAQATWFISPEQALESARKKVDAGTPYDCCILDMKMPEMDGKELARKLREILGDEPTFILLSGYNLDLLRRNYAGPDINGFLQKPIFPSTFTSTLNRIAQGIEEPKLAPESYDTKGLQILLAEDNAINARIARNILENAGAQVDIAPDGQRAYEFYLTAQPGFYDVVLMDIRMPHMDGYEATRFIRSSSRADAKTLPIYAMTANASREDIDLSQQAGMNGHITKPIDVDKLMATLQHVKKTSPKDFE